MTMSAPVLQAQSLRFAYRGRPVFDGASFAFAPGLTWLQGPNGSGKSTLLKLLGGALDPASGRRVAAGIDASEAPLEYRRRVFWCGAGPLPFDHLRAPEYFGFLAGLYPHFDTPLLDALVQDFALAAQLHVPIRSLSTGTQRKVALCAALCAGTDAVLLDEPLDALDDAAVARARQLFAQRRDDARRAWIVASHPPPCDGADALASVRLGAATAPASSR